MKFFRKLNAGLALVGIVQGIRELWPAALEELEAALPDWKGRLPILRQVALLVEQAREVVRFIR